MSCLAPVDQARISPCMTNPVKLAESFCDECHVHPGALARIPEASNLARQVSA
jgi:hypothetical protein